MTPFEIELQQKMQKLADDMKCIGNGYGWAVESTLNILLPTLEKHVPGFNSKNVNVDCTDY